MKGHGMASTIEFNQSDLLDQPNKKGALSEKIRAIHEVVKRSYGFIHRISIAVYDPKLDLVRTFAHSTDKGNPLTHYQAKLADAASLNQIFRSGKPRVVNDLSAFRDSHHKHATRMIVQGFRASYTIPMYSNDQLTGFFFSTPSSPTCSVKTLIDNRNAVEKIQSQFKDEKKHKTPGASAPCTGRLPLRSTFVSPPLPPAQTATQAIRPF